MSGAKVTVIGASMHDNAGDDMIAYQIKTLLSKSRVIDKNITLTNPHLVDDSLIQNSDLIIIGGGGLLYSTELENLKQYNRIGKLAKKYNKPLGMICVGTQGPSSPKDMHNFLELFDSCEVITTRSKKDTTEILDSGTKTKVLTGQDLALLYRPNLILRIIKSLRPKRKPILAFSLMNWEIDYINHDLIYSGFSYDHKDYMRYIRNELFELTKDYKIKLICHAREDRAFYKELSEDLNLQLKIYSSNGDISKALKFFDEYLDADYVLTGRFHGLIAGLILRIPTVNWSLPKSKQTKLIESLPTKERPPSYSIREGLERNIFKEKDWLRIDHMITKSTLKKVSGTNLVHHRALEKLLSNL
jgi:polysaccharide pyruvyl transferase WcaK-like protein